MFTFPVSQNAVLSLGLYLSVGSKDETPATSGVCHLLERCAFMATSNRTHFRLTRELEAMGASVHASASRDCMVYTLDTMAARLPEATELLVDSVFNSQYHSWEVDDATVNLKKELEEKQKSPETMLDELLHSTAFDGGFGKQLVCHPSNLRNLTGETMRSFIRQEYQPQRTVLSASGCNHDDLMQVAEPLLGSIAPSAETPVRLKINRILLSFEYTDSQHAIKIAALHVYYRLSLRLSTEEDTERSVAKGRT
jgi:processing peptidase subunit alpha